MKACALLCEVTRKCALPIRKGGGNIRNVSEELIAHVTRNADGSWRTPQTLEEHLEKTAQKAELFASKFDSGVWGKTISWAHDVGKGRPAWQNSIRFRTGFNAFDEEAGLEGMPGKIPHAIQGAMLAEQIFGKQRGRIMAYCIAGHHAGLPDWSSAAGTGKASLEYQESQAPGLDDIDPSIVDGLSSLEPGMPPWKFANGLDMPLWIRMLFSCLVDADFLDTESYMDHDKASLRGEYAPLGLLLERFNEYNLKLDRDSDNTTVNEIRRKVRSKCIQMAAEDQGIFSLTVPTGGGKTLSSLAFGLNHAIKHSLDRIIYVIPYTSIIEQNAEVFRAVVGSEQVVEHHSNLDEKDSTYPSRLAAENWDAPIIVTTAVQFFESLFASRPGRCRKLHNIARSVVVLDEAQLLPAKFLQPILDTMQLLSDRYRVSFVISTATQPAFGQRMIGDSKFRGLKNIREIMGSPEEVDQIYRGLERYQVYFPPDLQVKSEWEDIARELKQYEQVLCVVSDRKSCRELYSLMPTGTYHLSALMCGQHRSEVITQIKQKIRDGSPVRVISTQLVEAGVDLDFPIVYRAFAGLDSIAQAAGRCNREGKLPQPGRVVVFIPPRPAPMGILRKAAETTVNIVNGNRKDPVHHSLFGRFFSELYWKINSLDENNIIKLLDPKQNDIKECSMYFRTAAARFRLIDESTHAIVVPYHDGAALIDSLKTNGPDWRLLRKLQRYTVNIYDQEFDQMMKRDALFEASPGVFALMSDADYHPDIGLMVEPYFDPDRFIL